ncbi:hypothetical protein DO97_03975 [Neosynechococcus sphagnicola sy1]|uniref:Methyltransferase domain-containing protein n=1 Tax=Neosynechococcus sphagnicola sy1 TaxID=1497020 RepID=A0A098TLY3_9CYAN|nr:hypothetical protein [Neosynechococcus sphagnicola]KGF72877.1 hypothetical protein DO97_03975 [Neosynechococcus sphagnicola sy1]
MLRPSTSIHGLNADRGLRLWQQPLYWLLNWVNNRRALADLDPHLQLRDFRPRHWQMVWPTLPLTSSPSRKLSDLFWVTLPWDALRQELGAIHVVDIGCGSGGYGDRLWHWSQQQISSYTGLDPYPHPHWSILKQQYPSFQFHQVAAQSILEVIPDQANFLISQSALEHIEADLTLFRQIHDWIARRHRPILQIHLLPSRACLQLYGYHGIRQYTPRTVSQISQLFQPPNEAFLFSLGGMACNRVHREFIPLPYPAGEGDRRQQFPQVYDQQLRAAIAADMQTPQASPTFYALVIHSHGQRRLLERPDGDQRS